MNPYPFLSLNHVTIPFSVIPLTLLGSATVDLQSASDPSQTQVTSSPSFVHAHFATTCSAVASAGADDMGVDGPGAAGDTSGTAADVATLGADAVAPDEHPAISNTPHTATEPSTAFTLTPMTIFHSRRSDDLRELRRSQPKTRGSQHIRHWSLKWGQKEPL